MFLPPRAMELTSRQLWWMRSILALIYSLVCSCLVSYRESLYITDLAGYGQALRYNIPPAATIISLPYGVFVAGLFIYYTCFPGALGPFWQVVVLILAFLLAFLFTF